MKRANPRPPRSSSGSETGGSRARICVKIGPHQPDPRARARAPGRGRSPRSSRGPRGPNAPRRTGGIDDRSAGTPRASSTRARRNGAARESGQGATSLTTAGASVSTAGRGAWSAARSGARAAAETGRRRDAECRPARGRDLRRGRRVRGVGERRAGRGAAQSPGQPRRGRRPRRFGTAKASPGGARTALTDTTNPTGTCCVLRNSRAKKKQLAEKRAAVWGDATIHSTGVAKVESGVMLSWVAMVSWRILGSVALRISNSEFWARATDSCMLDWPVQRKTSPTNRSEICSSRAARFRPQGIRDRPPASPAGSTANGHPCRLLLGRMQSASVTFTAAPGAVVP